MSGEMLRDRLAEIINDWVQGNWTYDSEVERSFAATPAAWSLADSLLPVIAAHVAAETETLRAEVDGQRESAEFFESLARAETARADDAEWRLALMRADRDAQAARADDTERRIAAVRALCDELEHRGGLHFLTGPEVASGVVQRLRAVLDPEADR